MPYFNEPKDCRGWWTSRTGLEQKLVILSTVLFIVAFALTITVIVYKNKKPDEVTTVAPVTSPSTDNTTGGSESPTTPTEVPGTTSEASTSPTEAPATTESTTSPTEAPTTTVAPTMDPTTTKHEQKSPEKNEQKSRILMELLSSGA
ncbi:uncharacterized protein CEXT_566602 [Caerostris extrusa]|uniref:Uncharacterized protein n=1 Tax=Caerostris extrusa TaxID=172846 RepID=A0AAV4XIT2_CAEEX|nr:uncharacterized protein CEXT_566602 [Caerostris extrusa]